MHGIFRDFVGDAGDPYERMYSAVSLSVGFR